MPDYRRNLPPMAALVAFEAAARRLSFTRAAEEMGITQAAVSRQVQALEAQFGFPLFLRRHRSLELTRRGRVLAETMSESLSRIAETVGGIAATPDSDQLSLSASVAFSHFWLLPRLADFRRANPGVRLRLIAQDGTSDLAEDEADLAIRYGSGRWPDGKVVRLFTDSVYPVCSPGYAARHGRPECVADLVRHLLIAAHPQEAHWLDWERWIGSFGTVESRPRIALTCNFYTDAVQAAMAGEGIALGWHRLIGDLVRQGQLLRVAQESWQTHEGYHLVLNRERRQRPVVAAFLGWIRATAAALDPLEPALR